MHLQDRKALPLNFEADIAANPSKRTSCRKASPKPSPKQRRPIAVGFKNHSQADQTIRTFAKCAHLEEALELLEAVDGLGGREPRQHRPVGLEVGAEGGDVGDEGLDLLDELALEADLQLGQPVADVHRQLAQLLPAVPQVAHLVRLLLGHAHLVPARALSL